MTSSIISNAPYLSHSARRPGRNSGSGGTQFMLPATGSTMMQAISEGYCSNAACTESRSLKVQVRVCLAKSAGTPGELGWPRVSAPEPALTSRQSAWPW
ncbi:hypothetical protein D3C71_1551860 [compost metagenome]